MINSRHVPFLLGALYSLDHPMHIFGGPDPPTPRKLTLPGCSDINSNISPRHHFGKDCIIAI